jgi:uncharacterized alkaline shock family protein YloU
MSDSTSEKKVTDETREQAGGQVAKPAPPPMRRAGGPAGSGYAALVTDMGTTQISDAVVAKIAGMATREVPGVHSMGRGLARRLGRMRAMVAGQPETSAVAQGVDVEVGQKEAAVDLDIVTWYGQSIVEISEAVRRNVIECIESMTGLKVVEVNINVDDIFIEGLDERPSEEPRVQ